jgi:hypothetical protein
MRKDMRGMSAMGMKRCYSSSSSDKNNNKNTDKDNKNNSIGKNRSNSISDDKVRSMNKDKLKKVAFENKMTSNKSSRKGSVYHQGTVP